MEVWSVCDPARTKGRGYHIGKIVRDADCRSWSQEELAYLLYWFGVTDWVKIQKSPVLQRYVRLYNLCLYMDNPGRVSMLISTWHS